MSDIEVWREKIDQINGQLLDLLIQRFEMAEKIAIKKVEDGTPICDHSREEAMLTVMQQQLKDHPQCDILIELLQQVIAKTRDHLLDQYKKTYKQVNR